MKMVKPNKLELGGSKRKILRDTLSDRSNSEMTGSYFTSNLDYISKLIQLNSTGRIFSRQT